MNKTCFTCRNLQIKDFTYGYCDVGLQGRVEPDDSCSRWSMSERNQGETEEKCQDVSGLKKELKDCRNELCLKCGRFTQMYMGACDGCRWKR